MEFKDAFPKEYHSLTGATVNDQIKKGYLLSARVHGSERPGMARPDAAKRGPDSDKGNKQRGRHSQPQPAGASPTVTSNS